MNNDLYTQFSGALRALPENDLPAALDAAETAVRRAARDHGPHDPFPSRGATGLSVDRILGVFAGHTVGEVADVMTRLRGELADVLSGRGASEDVVREMREGG